MQTFLLTWNPKKWQWTTLDADYGRFLNQGFLNYEWKCGQRRHFSVGDRVFLLKQGPELPRGIVASGTIRSNKPFPGPDPTNKGHRALFVKIRFDIILHPYSEPILPRTRLDSGALATVRWGTQVGGIEIKPHAATELEKVWRVFLAKRGITPIVRPSKASATQKRKAIAIHLVEKGDDFENLKCVNKSRDEWETGNWKVINATAESLVGGMVYLHKGQKLPSHKGGEIISFHHKRDSGEGRKVFRFRALASAENVIADGKWANEKKIVWQHSPDVSPIPMAATVTTQSREQNETNPIVFDKSDKPFQVWINRYPRGFVLNTKRSPGADYLWVHHGECPSLSGYTSLQKPGAYTERIYIKVCAQTTGSLAAWAVANRSKSQRWTVCTRCNPDAESSVSDTPVDTPVAIDSVLRPTTRIEVTTFRVLRDTQRARRVKAWHGNQCQICGHRILLTDGTFYSEAHHIKPLGEPHQGPDDESNILCLCPNHHAELDYAARPLSLAELRTASRHRVDQKYVDHHNKRHNGR